MSTAPPWPSLYDPGIEIIHIPHRNATQPGGVYLDHANVIFRFTLYWSLIFYTPIFIICGSYAFWNINFPPAPISKPTPHDTFHDTSQPSSPLSPLHTLRMTPLLRPSPPLKEKERRSRLTFALLVLLTFLTCGVGGAVIGSAVLGYTAAGLYKSAGFHMSTWVPFLLAVMQVVIGLLGLWPSVIDII